MKPRCRVCGGQVIHGNLYCSANCGQLSKNIKNAHKEALESEGFVASDVPNIYVKDGVAVTLEAVKHVGIDETLVQHAAALGRDKSL